MSNTVVEFFSAGSIKTPAMIESIASGALPGFLSGLVRLDINQFLIGAGAMACDATSVVFPRAGYDSLEISEQQLAELTGWLDRVAPDWAAAVDPYGNHAVKFTRPRAPILNLVSPESNGDYE